MKMILIAIMISFYEWFDDSNGDAYGYYSGYELIWIVWFELYYFFVGFYNVYNVCLEWTYTLQLPECQWTLARTKCNMRKFSWVLVYELSGCGSKSRCRYCLCLLKFLLIFLTTMRMRVVVIEVMLMNLIME